MVPLLAPLKHLIDKEVGCGLHLTMALTFHGANKER
jgi:hypothetical protein